MSIPDSIAIVGMACEFPGAHSPEELWRNVLAGRRYFRAAPRERLPREYFNPDPTAPGASYADKMAVLEGWAFDPLEFHIPPVSYAASDMAHWLALYVARAAFADSGIDLAAVDRARVGVVLGNTLTGEFSRSHNMRHRWPYAERSIRRVLDRADLDRARADVLLAAIRESYEGPLPEITEDSLAGNMSNTIAGRICGYFDCGGGGYTVDGACSSSLLAFAHACNALANREMDLVLAGGVDVSLDPFEIVGFAKARALAPDDIRPYDESAAGMLTGEGCGLFVLMRESDARARGRRIRAVVKGWGISSDGAGGITAPGVEGQTRALRAAYARAGYPISTVGLIEGHGTGAALGDKVEITAILRLLDAQSPTVPCRIGSIKAQIGHCKAAAGAAGLIKAILALERKILPPAVNCSRPNPAFGRPLGPLRPSIVGEAWASGDRPRRASVSAMGFGGANAHVTLEEADSEGVAAPADLALLGSPQATELVLIAAANVAELLARIEPLIPIADRICRAELTDLAAAQAKAIQGGPLRVAMIADSPWTLAEQLRRVTRRLRAGAELADVDDVEAGILAGAVEASPRLGALFPGQGTHRLNMGEPLRRRFPFVQALYDGAGASVAAAIFRDVPGADEATLETWELALRDTRMAQPAIVASSLATLEVLRFFGLEPSVSIGHSLGEISALHAAGAFDAATAIALARARGAAMADLDVADPGAMLAVAAPPAIVEPLLAGLDAAPTISNYNSHLQTVVSGGGAAIAALRSMCRAKGLRCSLLPVSHAFHSDIVAPAAAAFRAAIQSLLFAVPGGACISPSLGAAVEPGRDLRDLLAEQIRRPVRFVEAIEAAQRNPPDLWVEVGPGGVLTHFLQDIPAAKTVPRLRTDADGEEAFTQLGHVLGRAFVLGLPVRTDRLFAHRFHRPFALQSYNPIFIVNPCERPVALSAQIPRLGVDPTPEAPSERPARGAPDPAAEPEAGVADEPALLEFAVEWIAKRTGFPKSVIGYDKRFRDDLNLDSIKVGELVALLSRRLKRRVESDPGRLANATLNILVAALRATPDPSGAEAGSGANGIFDGLPVAGLADWVRSFRVAWRPAPVEREPERAVPAAGTAVVTADPADPRARAIAEALRRRGFAVRLAREGDLAEAPSDLAIWIVVDPADAASGHAPSLDRDSAGFAGRIEGFAARLFDAAKWALASRAENAPPLLGLVLRPKPVGADTGAEFDAGAAFVKSLAQDHPGVDLKWLSLPESLGAAEWAAIVERELAHAGRRSLSYDADGRRLAEMASPIAGPVAARSPILSAEDVVLVSGGGKGVTFELALALALRTGCKLALLGSSPPPDAPNGELADNLKRLRDAGIVHRYLQADVVDLEAVERAAAAAAAVLGPPTAILHGAGVSTPRRFGDKPFDEFLHCARVKARGLYNLLRVVPRSRLKALHAISSVLGHTGMRGQTDYTFANAWLDAAVRHVEAASPGVHCLTLGYSVWSGAGLGHKANLVDGLRAAGVAPIGVESGVAAYRRLIEDQPAGPTFVVTGALPSAFESRLYVPSERPRGRFLETPRRFVPGVEIVADATISRKTDLYLDEHAFDGAPLFPGVMALEAMVEAARACAGSDQLPVLRDIRFHRALTVPGEESVVLRTLALAAPAEDGALTVRLAMRSDQDGFRQAHYTAECVFGPPAASWPGLPPMPALPAPMAIDPEAFAPSPLFQGKLFRRISAVRVLSVEDRSLVDMTVPNGEVYFSGAHANAPIVTAPATLDAMLQAGAILLPPGFLPTRVSEARLVRRPNPGETLHCRVVLEKTAEGYRGDIDAWDEAGGPVAAIRGVDLESASGAPNAPRIVARPAPLADAVAALRQSRPKTLFSFDLAPHGSVADALLAEADRIRVAASVAAPRRASALAGLVAARRAALALAETAGRAPVDPMAIELAKRANGMPELRSAGALEGFDPSLTDSADLSAALIAPPPVGIDLEPVLSRDCETWQGLLGMDGYGLALRLARETGEPFDTSGSRVWSLIEAGKKAFGLRRIVPEFQGRDASGWLVLKAADADLGGEFLSAIVAHPEQPEIFLALAVVLPAETRRAAPARETAAPVAVSSSDVLREFGYDPASSGLSAAEDGPRGQLTLSQRFPVSFKHIKSQGGYVDFVGYADWLGAFRETALAPVRKALAASLAQNSWGMATNHVYMRIWGDAGLDDTLESRLRADAVSGNGDVVDLGCEFRRLSANGDAAPIATVAMRTSYIEITGHGEGRRTAPPEFFAQFLKRLAPPRPVADPCDEIAPHQRRVETIERGQELPRTPGNAGASPLLRAERIQTSPADSNVVGNIYFANYVGWLSRARDMFFHRHWPAQFGPRGEGEWFTLSCDIDHLSEAMPYDEVVVEMSLARLLERGLDLRFEYFLRAETGLGRKLAVARVGLVWVPRRRSSPSQSLPIPNAVLDGLREKWS